MEPYETYSTTDYANTHPPHSAATPTSSYTTFPTARPYSETYIGGSLSVGHETKKSGASSITMTAIQATTGIPTPQLVQDETHTPNELLGEGHDTHVQPEKNQPQVDGTATNATSSLNNYVVTASAAVVSMRWCGGAMVALLIAIGV